MFFFSALMRHEMFHCFVNIVALLLYMQSCSRDVNGTLKTEHGTKGRLYVIALSASTITCSKILVCLFQILPIFYVYMLETVQLEFWQDVTSQEGTTKEQLQK